MERVQQRPRVNEPDELVVIAGRCVVVRSLRDGDVPALTRFYESLDDDSRYRRFLQAMPRLPVGLVAAIASPVNQLTVAIGLGEHDRGSVLAEVVLSPSRDDPTLGEIAYTVDASVRRQRLATRCLHHALRRAHRHGIRHVDAYIGGENRASVALMRSLGATARFDSGLVVAELDLPVVAAERPLAEVVALPCLDRVPVGA